MSNNQEDKKYDKIKDHKDKIKPFIEINYTSLEGSYVSTMKI